MKQKGWVRVPAKANHFLSFKILFSKFNLHFSPAKGMDLFLNESLLLNVNDGVLSADDDFWRHLIQVDHHDTVRQLCRPIHERLELFVLVLWVASMDVMDFHN